MQHLSPNTHFSLTYFHRVCNTRLEKRKENFMALKKGPYGTLRRYSHSNGRYIRYEDRPPIRKKKKGRGKEMAEQKRKCLLNRARSSHDPYIYDVCLALEKSYPYCLQHVNDIIFDKSTRKGREIDIVTNKSIIEVKSGNVHKCLKQFLAQKQLASSLKRKHIVYAPDILKAAKAEYERHGVRIATTIEELIRMEGEK